MPNMLSAELINGEWDIYLRKSRQDDPRETVEEVLAKHEAILQEWARRELGREIPEANIYREIVSGESLSEREEVQKLLNRIEDPRVVGILVVEPQRLSRGDLEDCGKLISTLRYTKTLVATPTMVYDMENKMERRFFQDELMRGRDYLEYTKEILSRGRIASIKRGCFIGNRPPYGYDKVVIGKDHTLAPNDKADVVRLIFDWYVNERLTYYQIASRLNEMGVHTTFGGDWKKDTVATILRNKHYTGKVYYMRRQHVITVENGERRSRRFYMPEESQIIAEGKHQAIISNELFEQAQEILNKNPRLGHYRTLTNKFAGILVCGKCGKTMVRHPYHRSDDRLECRTKPMCFKSAKMTDVTNLLVDTLEKAELPALKGRLSNGDGESAKIQQKIIARLEKQMEELRLQEEKQYEFLETGRYTPAKFDERNALLRQKMEECSNQIHAAKIKLPKSIDLAKKVTALEDAIAALKDDSKTPDQINKVLKTILEKVEIVAEDGGGYDMTNIFLKVFLKL